MSEHPSGDRSPRYPRGGPPPFPDQVLHDAVNALREQPARSGAHEPQKTAMEVGISPSDLRNRGEAPTVDA